ncbi:UDP-N-acetylglucosamine 2-epimerase [Desulfopila inferna]|uniref:UDP-N-acetylglucosamine 2-epimerase n=1 Tax=Desulfopila inferna TaxID=468528 RepID=UPI00196441FC|nr:UDP-N-acetylglucosamine 2-epimerase [Desulfopila inferna]MBM9603015.1 UDP-N-acetylglucosamine 2-epimerase (hydrolyzing) [Desulfopila inferna]
MKKICVFTGSRAEYGLLKPLLDEIKQDSSLKLLLLVSGMHLSAVFGNTYKLIESDGFKIDRKVMTLDDGGTPLATCRSIAHGIVGYTEAFRELQPDILVLLGDRYETFAAATAALVSQLPIAHIHGGETTQGAIDEAFRHSITKMSLLHFTSTENYRQRVIQLGEHPDHVFDVGAIGLEYLDKGDFLSKNELEDALNFRFGKKNALVTFHPVTLEPGRATQQFSQLLAALDDLEELKIIFTKANADPEGRNINQLIDDYVIKNPKRTISFTSMGHQRYLSSMKIVDLVIGNSSSGIIEAPSFGVPVINVGSRQQGRIKAANIIDCLPEQKSILEACKKGLSQQFKNLAKAVDNPYRKKDTASQIKEIIKKTNATKRLKSFYDIPANTSSSKS